MAHLEMTTEQTLGLAAGMDFRGVSLDAGLRPVEAFGPDTDSEVLWYRLAGLQGSLLEHRVFEDQWAVQAVSADRLLALVDDAGMEIVTLMSGADLDGLPYDDALLGILENELSRGHEIRIPAEEVAVNDWQGTGWVVTDPDSGESGYYISGHYAGGATTEPPADWVLDFLVDALRFPYDAPPNEDPGSAARIRIIAATDNQIVGVGETPNLPPTVLVTDRYGRPVKGATVNFFITSGDGEFTGSGGQEYAVETDDLGVASAMVRVAEEISQAWIVNLRPGDENATLVGYLRVGAVVDASQGPIILGKPFRLYQVPGEPAFIEREWSLPASSDFTRLPYQGGIAYRVTDEHDNAVSNVDVSLFATDAMDCSGTGTLSTRFAESGQCSPHIQGLAPVCGTPTLSLLTDYQGRVVADLLLTNATYSSTLIEASAGPGINDAYQTVSPFGTQAPDPVCDEPDQTIEEWMRFSLEARTTAGWPMEAAEPLEVLGRERILVIGCLERGGTIYWDSEVSDLYCERLANSLNAEITASNGGTVMPLQIVAPKVYRFDLQAGPAPAWHQLDLQVDPIYHGALPATLLSGWLGDYFTVQGQVQLLNSPPIPINDDNRLADPVTVVQDYYPLNYRPNQSLTWIQQQGQNRNWNDSQIRDYPDQTVSADLDPRSEPPPRTYISDSTFEAGRYMDPHEDYEAAAILNPGTPWEIELEPASLSHGQRIIAGFDAHSLGDEQVLPEVLDRYPQHLRLTHDIDVANQIACQQGGILRFELNHEANVSLVFRYLDDQGEPTTVAWQAMDAETYQAGVHIVDIPMDRLRFGDFQYELTADSQVYDDVSESYAGSLSHKPNRRDVLPLAHAVAKNVDLHDGSLNISREDVSLGGRGPGIRFVRSYSSHRATQDGVFGFGWTHNYAAALRVTACGVHIISGADGQSMQFISEGDQNGVEVFRALRGYNGTLYGYSNGSYAFYAKDGTRYVMLPDPVSGYYLSEIEDTNGNTVELEYTLADGERLLTRVTDAAGRALVFEHETRQFEIEDRLIITRPVITAMNGPEDLRIDYEYDDHGNLVRATRRVGSAPGVIDEGYVYTDTDQAVTWPGDRPVGDFFFGYRLTEIRDRTNNATRNVGYQFGWDYYHDGSTLYSLPQQRVAEIIEPDGGDTDFNYSGDRGLEPVQTTVNDARGYDTLYQLNRYGAATEIAGPIGTERMAWDLDVMRRLWHEDANGLRRDFTYDSFANRTSETITGPYGTQDRSWTYLSPEEFGYPIKNRVGTATDWRGISTHFTYDDHGNLASRSRGGVTESFGYNGRGDRTSETDGTGYTRTLVYNDRGNPTRATDQYGLIQRQTWDELGRQVSMTDGEGFTTDYTLDTRGRKTRIDYPGPASKTIDYDDAENTRAETNARGVTTTYVHDDMGRLLEVSDALGVLEAYEYDHHGNIIRETDGRGHVREHDYDAEDRRERTMAPEGLVIEYDHDDAGNLTRERRGNPDDGWRVTEYEYDHPLYKRTRVRRINPDGEDAVETFDYDANGNRIERTDPRDHLTTWNYDDRDRVVTENAPEGRVTTYAYDDADRRIRTTLNTSPPQVRHMDYDGRGREISRTDATGAVWQKDYDRRGLVVRQTDPRGAEVTYDHDSRGRRIRMAGPLSDMVTEYAHDPMGNVVSELQPNGRLIESDYDIRDRVTLRTDQLGQIEAFGYDGNDNVIEEQDGEGRITRHFYNDLDHRIRSELPEDRTRRWGRNVFGEATSETNPRDFVTTHDYDALGRRITTILPDDSEITREYDPAGNRTLENDARGFVTTWTHDGLNRRTGRTDPGDTGTSQSWSYDTAGNVLTHTDRRGIETRTTYDGENRPLEERRAGVLMARYEYDAAGNETLMVDANGRETTHEYDLAGRKLTRTRPGNTETSWTYSPMGEVLTRTDPDGRVTTNTRDLRQHLETRTNNAGETTIHEYDLAGNRTRKIRPEEGEWEYEYDAADRLVEVTNPENESTTYTWDANGNHTGQTDAKNRTTTFEYDELDHLSARIYPDSTEEAYVHDAHGNRIEHTDADGQTRTFTYDSLDRRITASYPDATGSQAIQVEYEYDGNGNRTEVTESLAAGGTATTTFQYDAFDRLERETDRYGQTTAHVYDLKGNRIERIDATGTTTYGIDALDRTETITAPNRGAVQYTYSDAGLVTQIDHPDGTRTEQTYDEAGRIATVEHYNGGEREAYYEYAYDDNGNRISQIEDLGSGETETTYQYDGADRLTEVTRLDRTTEYVLDDVGNRTEEIVTDPGGTTVKTYAYNERDQLQTVHIDGVLEVEYEYDANGNRIQATTGGIIRHFNFSARDRLVSLNVQGSPPEVQWEYDDAGFRTSETTPSEVRRFRWDNETLSYETNVLGNILARYDHGPDRLLAETQGSTTRTWLTDALSTPVKRLNEDGTVYSFTRYDEYGEVAEENSPDIPRFGFTGHQRGPAEAPDLYYAQQRWYNAATGRFISEDPIWGEPRTPPSLHRYLYAYANPTIYIDPDGRNPRLENYVRSFLPEEKRNRLEAVERQRQTAQANIVIGAAQAAGESAVDLARLLAIYGAAKAEDMSEGLVNFGAQDRLDQGAKEAAKFLLNPVENTTNYVNQRRNAIRRLEEAGKQEEADRLKGRSAFEITSVLAGGYGAIRGGVSLLARQSRRGADAPTTTTTREASGGTGVVSAELERRMELVPDNDFGLTRNDRVDLIPLNRNSIRKLLRSRGLDKESAQGVVDSFSGQIYVRSGKEGEKFIVTESEKGAASGVFVTNDSAGFSPELRRRNLSLPPSNTAEVESIVELTRNQLLLEGRVAPQPWWGTDKAGGGWQVITDGGRSSGAVR